MRIQAQRGGIAQTIRAPAVEVVVLSKPRSVRFILDKNPVPIVQEAGWAPGPVWTERKVSPTAIRSPDRPAHSQSLYRLSYPGF